MDSGNNTPRHLANASAMIERISGAASEPCNRHCFPILFTSRHDGAAIAIVCFSDMFLCRAHSFAWRRCRAPGVLAASDDSCFFSAHVSPAYVAETVKDQLVRRQQKRIQRTHLVAACCAYITLLCLSSIWQLIHGCMYVCATMSSISQRTRARALYCARTRARGRLGTRTDANANTHERAARVACQHIEHIKHKHKHHHMAKTCLLKLARLFATYQPLCSYVVMYIAIARLQEALRLDTRNPLAL